MSWSAYIPICASVLASVNKHGLHSFIFLSISLSKTCHPSSFLCIHCFFFTSFCNLSCHMQYAKSYSSKYSARSIVMILCFTYLPESLRDERRQFLLTFLGICLAHFLCFTSNTKSEVSPYQCDNQDFHVFKHRISLKRSET